MVPARRIDFFFCRRTRTDEVEDEEAEDPAACPIQAPNQPGRTYKYKKRMGRRRDEAKERSEEMNHRLLVGRKKSNKTRSNGKKKEQTAAKLTQMIATTRIVVVGARFSVYVRKTFDSGGDEEKAQIRVRDELVGVGWQGLGKEREREKTRQTKKAEKLMD